MLARRGVCVQVRLLECDVKLAEHVQHCRNEERARPAGHRDQPAFGKAHRILGFWGKCLFLGRNEVISKCIFTVFDILVMPYSELIPVLNG